MALTATQYQQLVLAQVGDLDPDTGDPPDPPELGVLAKNNYIPLLWAQHVDKVARGGDGLRFLYVKRDAYDICLAIAAEQVSFSEGLSGESIQAGQKFDHRKAEYEAVVKEIEKMETWVSGQLGAPAVGTILAREPLLGIGRWPWHCRSALGERITGSPYVPLNNPNWRGR